MARVPEAGVITVAWRRFDGPRAGVEGGVYNPGAWTDTDERTYLLLRGEAAFPNYAPQTSVYLADAPACLLSQLWTVPVPARALDLAARIEDARPFQFGVETLVTHTVVPPGRFGPGVRAHGIQPWVSVLGRGTAGLINSAPILLPRLLQPIEKNWVLLTHDDRLHLVYSLDPLVIYAKDGDGWSLRKCHAGAWQRPGLVPRNSTHLLPFDGGYLGWWHTQLDGTYVHGAYWLDETLSLRRRTGILFTGDDVVDGWKPGVRYLSSYTVHEDGQLLRLWCGEGDAFASVGEVATATLRGHWR